MTGDTRSRSGALLVALLLLAREAGAEEKPPSDLEQRVAKLEAERSPVTVSGYVHIDWIAFRETSQDEVTQDGEPLNEDRFLVRRSRIRAESDRGYVHGAVELDANTVNGPQVRPANVEASFKFPASRPYPGPSVDPRTLPNETPWFIVTAGLFRTPFGFEVPEPARQRFWLERSTMSNALFPASFDLGLRVMGGFSFVRYALGIMNGDPIGERTFPGRDPNESKDLVFRVGAATDVTDQVRVEAGVSGLTGRGFHRGNPATKDQITWRDLNEDGVIDPLELEAKPGSPAEPSQSFKRFALGADLRLYVTIPVLGELSLRGEIVRGSNLDRGLFVADPVAASRDMRELGWYVGASQEITRWAQVGVRYDRYDPDADASEREPFALVPRDLSLSTWTFVAAARAGFGRLVAQYDHRENSFGRTAGGAPTTLADDSFTLRAEVRF